MKILFKLFLFFYNRNLIWEECPYILNEKITLLEITVKSKTSSFNITDYSGIFKSRWDIFKQAIKYYEKRI